MKLIQLIGTRNKTDFTLYLGHALNSLGHRILVIDSTQNQLYRHGYTNNSVTEHIFEFQNIDILYGVTNWVDVEEKLRSMNETSTNYDAIIMDVDHSPPLLEEWPTFHERFYIGDHEKLNQIRDKELLHILFDQTDNTEIRRLTFESHFRLDNGYFDHLMNNRPKWKSVHYHIEVDEVDTALRLQMQHEFNISFKRLSKQYKEVLQEVVSDIYEVHIKEVQDAIKPSLFRFGSKRKLVESNT